MHALPLEATSPNIGLRIRERQVTAMVLSKFALLNWREGVQGSVFETRSGTAMMAE